MTVSEESLTTLQSGGDTLVPTNKIRSTLRCSRKLFLQGDGLCDTGTILEAHVLYAGTLTHSDVSTIMLCS